jgi:hypothetical protein
MKCEIIDGKLVIVRESLTPTELFAVECFLDMHTWNNVKDRVILSNTGEVTE